MQGSYNYGIGQKYNNVRIDEAGDLDLGRKGERRAYILQVLNVKFCHGKFTDIIKNLEKGFILIGFSYKSLLISTVLDKEACLCRPRRE